MTKLEKVLYTARAILRRESLRIARHQSSHPEVEFQPGQHNVPTTGDAEVTAADAHTILEALDQVDETYRITLKLFYLSELSYCGIAAGAHGLPGQTRNSVGGLPSRA